jgi:hypothetical protein
MIGTARPGSGLMLIPCLVSGLVPGLCAIIRTTAPPAVVLSAGSRLIVPTSAPAAAAVIGPVAAAIVAPA